MERRWLEGKGSVGRGFSACVFDLDGTLFTVPVDWAAIRRDLEALTGEQIVEKSVFVFIQGMAMRRPDSLDKIFKIIDVYEEQAVPFSRPMPGAIGLLKSLEGARLALVTLQGRKACHRILAEHDLKDLFEVIITREDSIDRAGQLTMALGRAGFDLADTLFVGDRINDVVGARRAGVSVALVGRKSPIDVVPDFSFRRLSDFAKSVRPRRGRFTFKNGRARPRHK